MQIILPCLFFFLTIFLMMLILFPLFPILYFFPFLSVPYWHTCLPSVVFILLLCLFLDSLTWTNCTPCHTLLLGGHPWKVKGIVDILLSTCISSVSGLERPQHCSMRSTWVLFLLLKQIVVVCYSTYFWKIKGCLVPYVKLIVPLTSFLSSFYGFFWELCSKASDSSEEGKF